MINTVIRNLLTNAIKFTPKEGKIAVSSLLKDGKVMVCIKDNGIGMDVKQLADTFNISRGSSSKGTDGETGTGLGLVLCKEFIDRNKGDIWVESSINKGSTFCITLPKHN